MIYWNSEEGFRNNEKSGFSTVFYGGSFSISRSQRWGVDVECFFDRNVLLKGKEYDGVFITSYWNNVSVEVIICSTKYENDIKSNLINIGYKQEQIHTYSELRLKTDWVVSSANKFDLGKFASLKMDESEVPSIKIKKIRALSDCGIDIDLDTLEELGKQSRKEVLINSNGEGLISLKRFELDVTSKCTLRCKNCSNMMQYFDRPKDIDADIVISDYNRMLNLIDWTDDVLIIGGEPLIYPDLDKVLNAIIDNPNTDKKVGEIQIVTNGTIIPNENVLKSLYAAKCRVIISNYHEKSKSIGKLVHVLMKNNIQHTVLDLNFWANVEQYVDRPVLSDDALMEMRLNGCNTLHRVIDNGKFYLCCHIKSLDLLDAIPEFTDTSVNIYEEDAKGKIMKMLDRNEPLPKACTWCNGNSTEMWETGRIPVAVQCNERPIYRKYK